MAKKRSVGNLRLPESIPNIVPVDTLPLSADGPDVLDRGGELAATIEEAGGGTQLRDFIVTACNAYPAMLAALADGSEAARASALTTVAHLVDAV